MISGMQVQVSDAGLFLGGSPMTEQQIGALRSLLLFF